MRGLRRVAITPPTLRDDGAGARETLKHRAQRGQSLTRELDFPDHWNKPDVRGALFAMQGWVCAYGQCEIDPYDGGDVDHFRPKNGGKRVGHTGYWWLAYRFDNYLLACRRCNEHVKREQFPVRGDARADETHDDPELREHRLLVDPARDGNDAEACFRVDTLDDDCPVRPHADFDDNHPMRERVEETARLFHLNSNVDLRRPRIRARVDVLLALKNAGTAATLRLNAGRYHPHSATWRDALRTYAPAVSLPTPAEELQWLLDQLLARVNLWFKLLQKAHDDAWRARAEEIRWALAYLWADPPIADTRVVPAWLDAHKLTRWVEPLHHKLTQTAPAVR